MSDSSRKKKMSPYWRGAIVWTLIGLFGGPVFFFVRSGGQFDIRLLVIGALLGPVAGFLNHNLFERLSRRGNGDH